jgi:hypothetical protein
LMRSTILTCPARIIGDCYCLMIKNPVSLSKVFTAKGQ